MTVGDGPTGSPDTVARAAQLIGLFCPDVPAFGTVTAVAPEDVPDPDRQLLDHRGHMTVTMERLHGCSVELRVVAERVADDGMTGRYAREILLSRPDGAVVQFGIVRMDFATIDAAAAAAIRARSAPLGRILVKAGLLCEVQRVALLRVEPGPHLRGLVGATAPLHGRVAEIAVDGRPLIELLEIAVPAPIQPERPAGR
jgi:chorismate-pyruvate lyase